jgi:hypothetical protein
MWQDIVEEHGLAADAHAYNSIATWGSGDFVFGQETDWFSNVNKLRRQRGFRA